MEKDKECVLNINTFNIYWKQLLLNYRKKHTQELFKLYYSIFKDFSEKEVKIAFKNAIINQPYFPNVNEICKYLPNKLEQKLKEWDSIEEEIASEEEQEELKELLKDFK